MTTTDQQLDSEGTSKTICDVIRSLKWRKPSVLGGVTLAVYLTSLLLYVIAISSNHWVEITTTGSRVNAGLWSACTTGTEKSEICSKELFYFHLVKQASHWDTVHQWLMSFGLVIWFCEEFVVLFLVCLERSPDRDDIVVGVNLILTAITGICLFMTLVIVGSEARHAQNGVLSWSFSVAILSLLMVVVTGTMAAVIVHTGSIKGKLPCRSSTNKTGS